MYKNSSTITKPYTSGFSLIEIIVAIGVLGALATAVFVLINPPELIARARDAGRLSKIKSIGDALRSYEVTTGSYPTANSTWIDKLISSGALATHIAPVSGNRICTENEINGFCYTVTGSTAYVYTYAESEGEATKFTGGIGGESSNVLYGFDSATEKTCVRGGTYESPCGSYEIIDDAITIPNGSFEDWSTGPTGMADHWKKYNSSPATYMYRFNEEATDGRYSTQVASIYNGDGIKSKEYLPTLKSGKTYTLTFDAKVRIPCGGYYRVGFHNGTSFDASVQVTTCSTTMLRHTVVLTPTSDLTNERIAMIRTNNTTSYLYIDNLQISQ